MRDAWLKALPVLVRSLPIDPRRKLPIPFTTGTDPDTGEGAFAITDSVAVERCWFERLCAVCGNALPYWVAFLGGPGSADRWRGVYSDPWMHEVCAEASITLCPYIARPKVPRLTDSIDLADNLLRIPPGELPGKVDDWIMVICRRDLVTTTVRQSANGVGPVRLFRPGPDNPRRERIWRYDGNHLTETDTAR